MRRPCAESVRYGLKKASSRNTGSNRAAITFPRWGLRRESSSAREQERAGYRLACQAHVLDSIVVFVPEESRMGKQVVRKAAKEIKIDLKPAVKKYYVEMSPATLEDTRGDWERLEAELEKAHGLKDLTIDYQALMTLQGVVRLGEWKVTVSVWKEREVIKVEPGEVKKAYGLAVDIGTTTVAGYLCDLTDGRLVATASMMNPQVVYGEDVMSRISYTITHRRWPGTDEQGDCRRSERNRRRSGSAGRDQADGHRRHDHCW